MRQLILHRSLPVGEFTSSHEFVMHGPMGARSPQSDGEEAHEGGKAKAERVGLHKKEMTNAE
jgi:hypothetical protein